MNSLNKLTALAASAALVTIASATAAEMEVVRIDHGRAVTYALRPVEKAPTIAVFSRGRSIGHSTSVASTDTAKRDTVVQTGRGQALHISGAQR